MEALTVNVKNRHYSRIEEIWELDYSRVAPIPMFHVRWAKSIEHEDYFTTMVITTAKRTRKVNVQASGYLNEPWVLAKRGVPMLLHN